jgi:hypothetical protein
MLLEGIIDVCDPERRHISLKDIIGNDVVWKEKDGLLIATFRGAWVNYQGPNGWLDKFNKLGLVNAKTLEPFKIVTQEQYNQQIAATCTTI